ncbi:MAG: ABC transporter permease subunit [Mycobacteriales bacterium]
MRSSTAARFVAERTQRIPYFNEMAALVAALLVVQAFPLGAPTSVYVVGAVGAAPLVLAGIGVVLVYRANRFINFSQLELAVWAGGLFDGLARGRPLLRALHAACGCVSQYPGSTAVAINFAVAAVLAIAAAVLINSFIYVVLIRHFSRSGQLMLSLVSIYLAEALNGSQQQLTAGLAPQNLQRRGIIPAQLAPPVNPTVTIGGYPLHLADMLLLGCVVATLAGLAVYFRRSTTGIAIRAAAENPSRAQTLGISVVSVTSRVWALAGLLAGIAGVLGAFTGSSGPQSTSALTIPVEGFVLVLVLVVAARFVSLWVVALAGLVLGIMQAAVQLSFSSQTPLDAALVFVVGGLLLLQPDAPGRRGDRDDFSGAELIRELRPIPRELRDLDVVQRWIRTGAVSAAVLLLGLPWAMSVGQISLLVDYVIFTLVGLSILILSGWAGQAALGQFGFGAIGAWAAASSGLPFPVAVVLGGLAGAAAAVIFGVPGLKLRGLSLAVSSLAFSVSAYALFIDPRYLGSMIPGTLAAPRVFGFDLSSPTGYYYACLVVLALACAAVVGLRRTRTGRVLIALRANEPAAQSFGISPTRSRLAALAVAGFLAAVAGGLLAFQLGSVAPQEYVADNSVQYFVFSAIGGLGGLAGPLVGFTFGWLLTFLPSNPLLQYFATGLGALFLLYALPGGLAQGLYGARDAMLRRVAYRLRIPVPSLMGDKFAGVEGERVALDEPRAPSRRAGEAFPVLYKLPGQWALDRLGKADSGSERVGV